MTTKLKLFWFIFLSLFSTSCDNKTQPEEFDYGQIENNKYSNSFFNLEMTIPTGWIIQSKEQTENLDKDGKELFVGEDKNLKTAIKRSEGSSAVLVTVFQYEVGAAVDYNPSFSLISENLIHFK